MIKFLVCGLICLAIAAGAVAYISDFGIGDLLAPAPPAPVKKLQLPPKPAFLEKDIETLGAPIEEAINADLPAIIELQDTRRWRSETDPLIPSKDVVVGKAIMQEVVEYRLRALDAYRKGTKDPKAAQSAASLFLDRYSQAAGSQQGDFKAIRALGDAAIKAGSTDPVVLAYHVRAKHNLKEIAPGDAFNAYKKIQDEMGENAYPPPFLRFLLSAWNSDLALTSAVAGAPGPLMRQLAYAEAARFLVKETGEANPAVLLSFVQNSLRFDKDVPEQRAELFQACLSEPKIDPYIHHMLGGEYYLRLAWEARGDGYANAVTRDGWKKFEELMPRAARHFRRAWFLRPTLPYAAQRMIMVTRAGGDDSWLPEDWFHASVVAQFDYHDAYESFMFILMPRWGGSHQRIANFAKECIATGRWYTSVPNEAAEALRLIAIDDEAGELPGKNPAAAQIAAAYIDGFATAKEKGEVRPDDFADMLSRMTAILVQAGSFPQAQKGFDIGPENNDGWWNIDRRVGYRYSMGLSHAITGPAEESVKPVHEFLTREAVEAPSVADVEEMQKRLGEAKAGDSNPKSAQFYEIAGEMLAQLKTYAAGEWVDLTFGPNLTLWTARAAGYDQIDAKTLRLTGSQYYQMQMRPLVRFAPPYMVEAEIKVVSNGDTRPGVVIGSSATWVPSQPPFPQVLSAGRVIVGYNEYLQRQGKPSAADFEPDPTPQDGFQHLAIRRYPGETRMYAMHGLFMAHRNEEPANDFIVFGDLERFGGVTGDAVFRNLRIRRAPPRVNVNSENPDSLPALQADVDYYPECPDARKMLALGLVEQGRPAEALEQVAKAKAVYPKIHQLHRVEGMALCASGKWQPALEAFREEYRLFPRDVWSKIHEAWVLSTTPDEKLRNGQKARELVDALNEKKDPLLDGAWSFSITQAAVAAESGKFDEAKELAKLGEEAANTGYRREIAQRVRQAIDNDRPYRMPEAGEIPPPAAPVTKTRKPEKARKPKAEPEPEADKAPDAQTQN
jgi:tetratricopeptide (TPR) repeat protein